MPNAEAGWLPKPVLNKWADRPHQQWRHQEVGGPLYGYPNRTLNSSLAIQGPLAPFHSLLPSPPVFDFFVAPFLPTQSLLTV